LEHALALSLYFKCQKHGIPCTLEIGKTVDIERILEEIIEAARI